MIAARLLLFLHSLPAVHLGGFQIVLVIAGVLWLAFEPIWDFGRKYGNGRRYRR